MLLRLTMLLGLLAPPPASAAPDPVPHGVGDEGGAWLGGPDLDLMLDGDALADAPEAATPAAEPDEAEAVETLDLQVLTGTLEDGMRRVVIQGRDPARTLPLDLQEAPETTVAELRGLLTGANAREVRLHGVEVQAVLWSGSTAVHAVQGTLLPGARSVLLALGQATPPPEPRPSPLPGGLAKSWQTAEAQLTRTVREGRCQALPVATDEVLAVVVPPRYLDQARAQRDVAAAARMALCQAGARVTWDRLELRLGSLHFNLFDDAGTLRGGVRLKVDPASGTFAYPMFKKPGP